MFIEAINLFQLKNPELDYVAVILGKIKEELSIEKN